MPKLKLKPDSCVISWNELMHAIKKYLYLVFKELFIYLKGRIVGAGGDRSCTYWFIPQMAQAAEAGSG